MSAKPCFVDIEIFLSKPGKDGIFDNKAFSTLVGKLYVQDAIDAWLASLHTDETRRKYNRLLHKLIDKRMIDPTQRLVDLSVNRGVYFTIDKDFKDKKSVKTMCKTAYSRFCDFVRTRTLGYITAELTPADELECALATSVLDSIEATGHIDTFIKSITPPFDLMAMMIFLAGMSMRLRLRVSNSEKNILSLMERQIDFSTNIILFEEEQIYGVCPYAVKFPASFMHQLRAHLLTRLHQGQTSFIFYNTAGKKLFPRQVERSFQAASKSLNLDVPITPKMLSWMGCVSSLREKQKKIK